MENYEICCEQCKGSGISHDPKYFTRCIAPNCHEGMILTESGEKLIRFLLRHITIEDDCLRIRR